LLGIPAYSASCESGHYNGVSGDTTQCLIQNLKEFIRNGEPYARLSASIRPRTRSGWTVEWQLASIEASIVNVSQTTPSRENQSSPHTLHIGQLLHANRT